MIPRRARVPGPGPEFRFPIRRRTRPPRRLSSARASSSKALLVGGRRGERRARGSRVGLELARAFRGRERFARLVGSDALAAVRAKAAVIRRARRLKRAGELRVNVLDASFESTGREGRHSVRVEVDAAGGVAKGATPAGAATDVSGRDDVVPTLDSVCREGGYERARGTPNSRATVRRRKTVAKAGLLLRAVLRAAPVTKSFPLYGRDGETVGSARVAFEWARDDREDASDNREDASDAASDVLARLRR